MFDLSKIVLHVRSNDKPLLDMEVDCTKHTELAIRSVIGKIVSTLAMYTEDSSDLGATKNDLHGYVGSLLSGDCKYKELSSPASPLLTIHPYGTKLFLINGKEYHLAVTRYYGNKESWAS